MVIKIDTHKSGPFPFSKLYSSAELEEVLTAVQRLNEMVSGLPVLPRYASRLQGELIRQSIFGTAAIEGNPLTEEQVEEVLEGDAEHLENIAEQEIVNLKNAYQIIGGIEKQEVNLSEELIKKAHLMITEGIDYKGNEPGSYRNHKVKVGGSEYGGTHTPPKIIDDIKTLMGSFIEWINSEELLGLDPIFRGALTHYHLCMIHPFGNGNGRTARLMEAFILHCSGMRYTPLMLSNYYYRHKDDYFRVFPKTTKSPGHDRTPFLKFVLEGLHESLKDIKVRVDYLIRILAIKDSVDFMRQERTLIRRQHDLLNILLDYNVRFTLYDLPSISPFNILYGSVSERTARRDLAKLTNMGLLLHKKDKYRLNIHFLG